MMTGAMPSTELSSEVPHMGQYMATYGPIQGHYAHTWPHMSPYMAPLMTTDGNRWGLGKSTGIPLRELSTGQGTMGPVCLNLPGHLGFLEAP